MSEYKRTAMAPMLAEEMAKLPEDITGHPVYFDALAFGAIIWPRPAEDDVYSLHIRYEGKKPK